MTDPIQTVPEADKVQEIIVKPSIYGLFDVDGNLRYIGKADCPVKRLASHMRDSIRRDTPVYRWIRKNGTPEMRVLVSECEDWDATERELIRIAREEGLPILNVADGGNTPHQTKEQRQKNGLATIAKLISGTTPIKPCSKEDVIRDGYNFLRYFGKTRGMKDMHDRVCAKMRLLYQEDPLSYKAWARV